MEIFDNDIFGEFFDNDIFGEFMAISVNLGRYDVK